jgi:hypothetical protein
MNAGVSLTNVSASNNFLPAAEGIGREIPIVGMSKQNLAGAAVF